MRQPFEIACGSIIGQDHLSDGKNNQDACDVRTSDEAIIAVVCDGCGCGAHSEVGAHVGARLVSHTMGRYLQRFSATPHLLLERVQQDVLAHLRVLALNMGESLSQTVSDFFLFTVVGVFITSERAAVFSLGDGVFAVNGDITRIGPFPNNEPPYLAYDLASTDCRSEWKFQVHRLMPADEVQSILIGTDGVADFEKVAESNVPGKSEKVGALSQFWGDERYFRNRDAVRRKLAAVNRSATRTDWEARRTVKESGLLPDDTTLVVIRRKATV
jgi:hypothetical protein